MRKYKKIYLEHMDNYCYDEIILDSTLLNSSRYELLRYMMTERSKYSENDVIKLNKGSLPDLNRCGSVTPNTALLGIYDTL